MIALHNENSANPQTMIDKALRGGETTMKCAAAGELALPDLGPVEIRNCTQDSGIPARVTAFAYVANGRNGLKVVQLTSPDSQRGFYGFSPPPKPELIA